MSTPQRILIKYQQWKNHWDDLCKRCGQCCYVRHFSLTGKVVVDYSSPCEFLDEKTHLCRVFDNRFQRCSYCKRINLPRALFHPAMPPDCAYVQTFRIWRKKG